jgi:hypothetical protein
MVSKNPSGGSACKYIKKAKNCISPCKKVHNEKTKHKWYCKKTKRCSGKPRKRMKKSKTMKKSKKSVSKPESVVESKPESVVESKPVVESNPENITNVATKAFSDFSKAASSFVNPNPSKTGEEVKVGEEKKVGEEGKV